MPAANPRGCGCGSGARSGSGGVPSSADGADGSGYYDYNYDTEPDDHSCLSFGARDLLLEFTNSLNHSRSKRPSAAAKFAGGW